VETAAGQIGSSYPAVARTDLSTVVTELETLSSVRALPQSGMAALPIIAVYTHVISVLLTFDNDLAAGSSSPQLAQTVSSLGDIAQMADEASQQRAILYAELIQGQFGIGGLQALINAQSAQGQRPVRIPERRAEPARVRPVIGPVLPPSPKSSSSTTSSPDRVSTRPRRSSRTPSSAGTTASRRSSQAVDRKRGTGT